VTKVVASLRRGDISHAQHASLLIVGVRRKGREATAAQSLGGSFFSTISCFHPFVVS
jgi:hypothetical protein